MESYKVVSSIWGCMDTLSNNLEVSMQNTLYNTVDTETHNIKNKSYIFLTNNKNKKHALFSLRELYGFVQSLNTAQTQDGTQVNHTPEMCKFYPSIVIIRDDDKYQLWVYATTETFLLCCLTSNDMFFLTRVLEGALNNYLVLQAMCRPVGSLGTPTDNTGVFTPTTIGAPNPSWAENIEDDIADATISINNTGV